MQLGGKGRLAVNSLCILYTLLTLFNESVEAYKILFGITLTSKKKKEDTKHTGDSYEV